MSSTGRGPRKGGAKDYYVTPIWCCQLLAYTVMRLGKHDDGFERVVDIGSACGRVGSIVRDHIQKRIHIRSDVDRIPLVMIDIKKPEAFYDPEMSKYDIFGKGIILAGRFKVR